MEGICYNFLKGHLLVYLVRCSLSLPLSLSLSLSLIIQTPSPSLSLVHVLYGVLI